MKPTEICSLLFALTILHIPNSLAIPTKNTAFGSQNRFVGFHGSCSDNKESLEEEIVVRESSMMRQLGDRFYTTDSAASAFEFGRAACSSNVAGPDEVKRVPMVCSILVAADKLPLVPKVFIPPQVPPSRRRQRSGFNDENSYLYYNENSMEIYEEILLKENWKKWHEKMINIPPVRFSTSTFVKRGFNSVSETNDGKVFDTDIQGAWSKEAIKVLSMKAYCRAVKAESDIQSYKTAGIKDWLSGKDDSEFTEAWGEIYGIEEFKI
ncbi:hypothetical protein BKA69DRAFT_1127518 [Paraphysoderma sedebokerense]|nr:hypothetical protein BKA69DRAFT_1127518 [Paraphysoderma sedebokerense]